MRASASTPPHAERRGTAGALRCAPRAATPPATRRASEKGAKIALLALLALLIASFAGLLAGRWRTLLPIVVAIPACAILAGPVAATLATLAAVGAGVGVHLHHVVAEG